jgi:spore germination protein YaaH
MLLGVAFVGYDWPLEGSGAAISMREALIRARRTGADVQWDAQAQAPYFVAFGRTVYFEDSRSITHKLSLAAHHGLAGVAFWRLGFETPTVWNSAAAYLKPPLSQSARR